MYFGVQINEVFIIRAVLRKGIHGTELDDFN